MAKLVGTAGNVLVASQLVEDCEDAWDEQAGTGVTATADTTDYKVGAASAKFVLTTAAIVEITASEVVASMNLSTYTQLMFWVKSSITLSAADFQLLLDDSALCATPIVTLNIPALVANTWTYCKVAADLSGCTAIISVGLKQAVDKGAMSIWLDDIRAAKAIVGIRSWSLDYIYEVLETTDFSVAGVASYIPGATRWSGRFEGFKDALPLGIGTIIGLELQESATATQQWRGNAIITAAHPVTEHNALVAYAYDYQGSGALVVATA